MNTTLPFACLLAVALAGCSTTIPLNKVSNESSGIVSLKDNRPAEERIHRRDGVLVPIQFFGDEDFDSPPLQQFSLMLGSRLPAGQYDLAVTKFRVVDVFPQRLKTTTDAALAGALLSLGVSTIYSSQPNLAQDNITCLISGSLGPKPIDAAESVPYKVSPTSALLKNDPSFIGAVNECLVRLSNRLAKPI